MGVIGLEPESGTAGVQDLANACGWPAWSFGPSVLTIAHDWTAVFNRKERCLTAIVHTDDEGDGAVDMVLFQARMVVPISPTVWDAVEQVGQVLLCGVVNGGPTTAALQAATTAGELRAVVAGAHVA